jgi:hypothetical protein
MSCCGNQRARVAMTPPRPAPVRVEPPLVSSLSPIAARPPLPAPAGADSSASGASRVFFSYVGATALTVFGPVSGTRYRFTSPGATLAVDPRDQSGLALVPHLRRVARR